MGVAMRICLLKQHLYREGEESGSQLGGGGGGGGVLGGLEYNITPQ